MQILHLHQHVVVEEDAGLWNGAGEGVEAWLCPCEHIRQYLTVPSHIAHPTISSTRTHAGVASW